MEYRIMVKDQSYGEVENSPSTIIRFSQSAKMCIRLMHKAPPRVQDKFFPDMPHAAFFWSQ